jgi:antitoxin FitA
VASVSVRGLEEDVARALRVRAARHGRSMEAEIRAILTAAVDEPDRRQGLFPTLLERFSTLGGVELDLPKREGAPRAVDLGG